MPFQADFGTDIGPACAGCGGQIWGYQLQHDADRTVKARCAGCHLVASFELHRDLDLAGLTSRGLRLAHFAVVLKNAK